MNSSFFQSQSWLFQLAYFVKCKRTLLKLNFYQPYRPYPSSWGDWIVIACLRPPRNVKLGIFRGSRAVDGKEMYKKALFCLVRLNCLFDFLVSRYPGARPPLLENFRPAFSPNPCSETQGQLVGSIKCPWVNFHHGHFIDPTNCPWVSEDAPDPTDCP